MRISELEQKLLEYVAIGSIKPANKYTFVYLYDKSRILFLNSDNQKEFGFGNGVSFILTPEGRKQIYNLLINNRDKFDLKKYDGIKAGTLDAEQIKSIVLNNLILEPRHTINDEDIILFFRDTLANQDAKKILGQLETGIKYGLKIDDISKLDQLLTADTPIRFSVSSPNEYIVIDHENKKVYIGDESKRTSARMHNYSGSGEYVLPFGDMSVSREDYLKLEKQLQKSLALVGYTFSDFSERKTSNYREQLRALKQLQWGKPILAFHGTSNAVWKDIKEEGGMIPGKGRDYSDKIKGHSEHLIYLTLNPDVARRYAIRASGAKNYVILKIETVLDPTKIVFDEDSLARAVNSTFAKTSPKLKPLLDLAIKLFDTTGTENRYNALSNISTLLRRPGEKITPEQNLILDYFRNRALAVLEEGSFAYKGKIPLDKITLWETGKSEKASDDKYSDQYDNVIKNIKRT